MSRCGYAAFFILSLIANFSNEVFDTPFYGAFDSEFPFLVRIPPQRPGLLHSSTFLAKPRPHPRTAGPIFLSDARLSMPRFLLSKPPLARLTSESLAFLLPHLSAGLKAEVSFTQFLHKHFDLSLSAAPNIADGQSEAFERVPTNLGLF